MIRPSSICAACAVGFVLMAPARATAADAPDWLKDAARIHVSALPARDAVVLVDDVEVIVAEGGRSVTTRRRYAVRVLSEDGAAAAAVREIYTTDAGRVRTMRGWILHDGSTELDRAATVDVALAANDVYNEVRARILSAGSRIEAGAVFGAETELVERTVFTQFDWPLQDRWAAQSVRRVLTLPAGWEARWLTLNGEDIAPTREGTSYTWSAQQLAAPSIETASPPASRTVPRLAVSYFESSRSAAFDSWAGVSTWLASLSDPAGALTPAVTAKANELAGAWRTEVDRIRAIAKFVQSVRYISIQTGIGRGGGYVPHGAADVLAKNYGDCKDKAGLMRALLAAIGIEAHLVAVYSGDPEYVRAEWPSPQQFNHAIVAIRVSGDVDMPAATTTEDGSTLLFFDPTDEYTPIGFLPGNQQGSRALLVRREAGALVRLPVAPAAHATVRVVEGALQGDGGLLARIRITAQGAPAHAHRAVRAIASAREYAHLLESDVRTSFPDARVTEHTSTDDPARDQVELSLQIFAREFAQALPGPIVIVRPPRLGGSPLPVLPSGERRGPLLLDAREERDELAIDLPPGMAVDELPAAHVRDTPFGRFSIAWSTRDGRLMRSVTLHVRRATVPADRYPAVREFFDAFRAAEADAAVLVRR